MNFMIMEIMSMIDIKELAIAVAFLEGVGANKLIEYKFSEEDRSLFYDWFMKEWDDKWDQGMMDAYIELIGKKINELKGI